jgi:hypothetical protein
MTPAPPQTDPDDGPVTPLPSSGGGPANPDDESIRPTDEPGVETPVVPRVVDDVYDPRTRTDRTSLPGLDPPL